MVGRTAVALGLLPVTTLLLGIDKETTTGLLDGAWTVTVPQDRIGLLSMGSPIDPLFGE